MQQEKAEKLILRDSLTDKSRKSFAERSVRKKERRRSAGWKKSWRKKNLPLQSKIRKISQKNKRKKPEDRRRKDRLR